LKQKKEFIKSTLIAFIVRLVGALSGFLMSLFITRNLSVEESGLFFLGFAICTFIGTFCTLGFTNVFIRFIGAYSADKNWAIVKGVYNKGIKYAFITSVIVGGIFFFFSDFLSIQLFNKPELSPVLSVVALTIPFFCLYQLLSFAFQGLHKAVFSIFLQNISTQFIIILALAYVWFFSFDISAKHLVIVLTVAAFITFCIGVYAWLSRPENNVKADYSINAELIASAKPLWVMMMLASLVQYSGQFITGIYASAEQVAFFSVAQRLAMLTSFVLIAVNMVSAPRFAASAKQGNKEELRATSLIASRVMVTLATPVLIFMLVFPEFLMGLFGEEYKQAAHLLRILVIGQFINVVTGSVGFLLNMSGYEKDMRNVVFFSGPLAISLGFLLTPIYGTTGAAVATAIALASQNLIAVYMVKKRLGFNTLNLWKQ